ncbi:hypothetical protein F4803DRAFT_18963 [Xylaria telfairii]|nr:hypothetical protein F4803DRAFT_18963 [Xylaria telfairii]
MDRRVVFRLRRLLPLPISFRLVSYLPRPIQSFLRRPHARSPTQRRRKLHATSYLDGLRGLAALIFFVCCYTEANHPALTPWYGVSPYPSSWIQLPFLRVVFSGRPMVHIFFVITGFALSLKALTAVRARGFVRCYSTLASAALRRQIQLCGPPVVSIILIVAFIRTGWRWDALPALGLQLGGSIPARLYPSDGVSLWTIPIEICYSAVLFLMVLALSCMRQKARVAFGLIFGVYCLHYGRWAAAESIGGMLLAEAHFASVGRERCESLPLINSAPCLNRLEGTEMETSQRNTRRLMIKRIETTLQITVLSAALFIAGWPNADSLRTPGIRHLVHIVPRGFDPRDPQGPQKFWFAIAAMGVVWSCGRLTFVRKMILESRFMQYAGRLSFAIYIVHGPREWFLP